MALMISDICVEKDGKQVVSDLSVSIGPGRMTAVLGANGAGKSELCLGIAGTLPVSAGRISVDGEDITNASPDFVRRAGVAVVPEGHRVLTNLTVDDNLRAAGSILADGLAINLDHVYGVFPELAERRQQRAGTLSGGQQQMLAIGHALVSRPRYLVLDEMSLGLAPLIVKRLMQVATDLMGEGNGILLIEQFTELALEHADYALVLNRGRAAYSGPPATLKQDPTILKKAYLA